MPNIIQILRSITNTSRPTGRAQGEPYWNEANRQFGVVNAAGVATDLIAVRFFNAASSYVGGDHVIQGGELWVALGVVPPAAFNPAQWQLVGSGGTNFLPLGGGTLTGPLILAADPALPLGAATMQFVEGIVAPYLPLVGGTLTGPLLLSGAPTIPAHAADKAYVDTELGLFLPKTAGSTQALTGELYLPAPAPTQPQIAANKAYVDAGDAILQGEIDILTSNLLFSGSINVVTNVGAYTPASGIAPGALPAAAPANENFYIIVSTGGTAAAGNIPAGVYAAGDWLVSTGAPPWIRLPLGQANVIASNVAITPPIAALGANVQTGLTWLDTFKLDLAGGTMTGPLTLDADPAAPLEPVTLQFLDDIIIDAGVYP
jgi:hypothetical protein